LKAYEASRAIIYRLTEVDPRNTAWQYDLGISHARIGLMLESQGDFASAVEEYEACLAIAKRLAAANRDNALVQRNLALVYGKLAAAHHHLGKSGQAITELQRGRKIIAALIEVAPGIERLTGDLELFEHRISALEGRGQRDGDSPSGTAFSMTLSTAMTSAAEADQVQEPAD
jgi:tetratricopeptide (TPR) repeat protein